MPKDEHLFSSIAGPAAQPGLPGFWSAPQARIDLGGDVAVWAEHGSAQSITRSLNPSPWMVLHGGPGASLGAAHVAPLRQAGLPWFGFDQRNSGLSEDLELSAIDLQRFVDDALDVADHLGVSRFHILGGSWGATLALAIAAYRPERVASLVLRAPFVPLRARVDAFFGLLEQIDPNYFAEHFGPGARTDVVCECFDVATPEHLLELAIAWSQLELALLTGKGRALDRNIPFRTDVQELALVRKYRLQAHFLKHDCFLSPSDWNGLMEKSALADWPLSIVQGLDDRVCPPGGARMISEMVSRTVLIELENTAHLADSSSMIKTLSQEAARHFQLSERS